MSSQNEFTKAICRILLTLSRARVIIALGTQFWPVSIATRLVRDTLTVKVIMDFGALYIHPVTRLVRDTLTVKVIMDFGALYIHPVEYA